MDTEDVQPECPEIQWEKAATNVTVPESAAPTHEPPVMRTGSLGLESPVPLVR
jgi:hypothetical protein